MVFFFNFLISLKRFLLLINIIFRSVHSALASEHLERGGDDQGAGGGQQRHRLHRRLHRPRTTQPSHHPGQCLFSPSLLGLFSTSPILYLLSSNSCHFLPRTPSPSIGSPLHFPSPLFHRGSIVNWAPAHTTCESPSHPDLRPWPRPMEPVCARSRHPSTLPQDLWSPYTKQAPQPRPRETSRHLLFNHLQLGDMRFITCTHGTNAPRSHPP